jgi:hypothetical protein
MSLRTLISRTLQYSRISSYKIESSTNIPTDLRRGEICSRSVYMMPSRYKENTLRSVFQLHAAIRKFDIKHPENAASIPYVRSKCLNQLHYSLLLYFHLINAGKLMMLWLPVFVIFAISIVELLLLCNGLCRHNLGQPLEARSLKP